MVHIKTKTRGHGYTRNNWYEYFFGPLEQYNNTPSERYMGAGSGVIISQEGYIVTNNHVIENADVVEVTLNDKRSYTAQIIGNDPSTDLAVLKIDDTQLPFLPFGNSDHTRVGEWVLAVGNPFNLTSTVTAGIISAKARNMHMLDKGRGTAIESFIQTDAAINPGNSGGALVNMQGELVGINAAIASNTGSYAGYAFAIPSNLAQRVVGDIIQYGSAQRAYLGVSIAEITDKVAKQLDLEDIEGVYVANVVAQGAADEAGIRQGDIILQIEGQKVNTTSELIGKIAQYHPGEIISVLVKTNKGNKTYDVHLQNIDGNTDIKPGKREDNYVQVLEAAFKQPSAELQNLLGIDYGMQIATLNPGILSKKGIKKGLIILKLNQKKVNDTEDIRRIINSADNGLLIEGMYPNGMHVYYGIGLE
ncbi:MAG: deoxyribonuclease HsdR [Bacteroidia bacterium]|nr:MAG: deoxyribonuclease HsdR [Bacteroidia bacterium]